MVAAELFAEILKRQHKAKRDAGLVRVQEAAHVEIGRAIVDRAVAQQDFEGGAFAFWQRERVLDVIGVDLDDFLDALEEMRRAGVGGAFVAFLRDELRCVAFGEEHHVGIDGATVGMNADDAVVLVAEQAVDRRLRENVRAERFREFGEVVIVGGAQNGVAIGEGGRVAVAESGERVAIVDVEATFGDGTFVGGVANHLFAKDIRLGEVLGEIDRARPILRPGKRAGLDDKDRDVRLRQSDGGGDTGWSCPHDDDVIFPGSHARIIIESP